MHKKSKAIVFAGEGIAKNYLTKQLLQRASRTGTSQAARDTINRMGYTMVVQNGWLVRKEKDGTVTRIKRLEKTSHRKGKIID